MRVWLAGGAGASLWIVTWVALWRTARPLTFAPETPWRVRARDAVVRFMQRRWSARILEEMAVLGWPPAMAGFWALFFAALGGVPALLVSRSSLVALCVAGGAGWIGPQLWIHRNFVSWQQDLLRDFVPLVLLLSVYFDLGLSPERALEEALPAMGVNTAAQIRFLLTSWHEQVDTPAGALQTWAARLKLLPYQQLADVLAHHLDRGLSGDALKPLHTLISAQQQQSARALADRVDQQITVVPALAMMGLMLIVLFTFFAHGLGAGGGITIL